MTAAIPQQSTIKGIALMLVGIGLFAFSDALGKVLIARFGVGQILLVRSAAALCVLAPFVWRDMGRAGWVLPNPWMQVARAILATVEVILFYAAIRRLPLAEAMTFYLAAPIYVTALAPFCLGERVGWRRWLAVLVGFLGVVVALDPRASGISAGQALALAGSLCFAILLVTTRSLRATPDSVLMGGQLFAALLYGVVTAPADWVPSSTTALIGLALIGLLSMSGYLCVNRALRIADASIVAPFQYTIIAWAVLFGFLLFGNIPKPMTCLGATIIIMAGSFIFARERARAQRGATPGALPGVMNESREREDRLAQPVDRR